MLDNNVRILGKNNFVDPSARGVLIVGNNCKVMGALTNVFIVGDGIIVTESNTVIFGDSAAEDLTDFHSGFNRIEIFEEYTIRERKQMINYNQLILNGTLNIEGDFIME